MVELAEKFEKDVERLNELLVKLLASSHDSTIMDQDDIIAAMVCIRTIADYGKLLVEEAKTLEEMNMKIDKLMARK